MNAIESLLEKGILVSPEVLEDKKISALLSQIKDSDLEEVTVIDKDFMRRIGLADDSPKLSDKYKIISSYNKKAKKLGVIDFVSYFNRRFEQLSFFLRQRPEFQRTMSINRLKAKKEKERITAIGLVFEKNTTKNNHIILTIEDPSGMISVLIKADKKELYEQAKDMALDEIVGVEGTISGDIIFANQLYFPDIPMTKELKKSPVEEFMVLFGDPHFGSKAFLKEEFESFISWINGKKGSPEQKEMTSKIKYLLIVGDLVEGVGIYPGQENDLAIRDIKDQYDAFTNYLKQIPSSITIFICPGNHDAGRLSEPQPPILHKYAQSLRSLPNVVLVSNPALINLGAAEGFSGFDVLIYHGYSMIYYSDHVESIRSKGGQKRADLIMKFLLQRRHLAPTHTSNLYIPDCDEDPLVITTVPDFFVTGHIHRMTATNYRNITMANCSCWTGMTEDMEKRGLQNQPAKILVANLKTRDLKIINFLKDKEQDEDKKKAEDDDDDIKKEERKL